MRRSITRSWRPQRLGCVVFTGRSQVRRGSIDAVGIDIATTYAIWRVRDHDGEPVARIVGNYLDAERALLDATAELDAVDQP